MVEFVSLLLGLAVGPKDVELAVGAEVASIELLLDSERCGSASAPPWLILCDFGPVLVPHRLEAIARDGDGRETGRAEQWVNVPRPRAEAALSLESSTEGGPRRARLIWEAIDFEQPQEVEVFFDGTELSGFDGEWIDLPQHDPAVLHVLSAEIRFSEDVTARADIAFGGAYGERISSNLTAIAAEAAGRRLPRVEDVEGRILAAGRPVRVVAIERPPLDLVVVREQSASLFEALRHLATVGSSQRVPVRRLLPQILGPTDRVLFVFPTVSPVQGQSNVFEVMPTSVDVTRAPIQLGAGTSRRPSAGGHTLFQILTGIDFPDYRESLEEQRLADAVAVGGLLAARANRRRAVLLVRTGEARDASLVELPIARHYLNKLAVPLTIWTLKPRGRLEDGAALPEGGLVLEDWKDFSKAYRQLSAALDRQFVIWVEGRYLPQTIRLAADTKGFSLARRPSATLDEAVAGAARRALAPTAARPPGAATPDHARPAARGRTWLTDPRRVERARSHLGSPVFTPLLGSVHLVTDLAAPRLIRSLHRIATQAPDLYHRHWGAPADLATGATAVLFADEASYRAFEHELGLSEAGLVGHATGGLIALYAGHRAQGEIERTFLHELTHLLNIRTFGPDLRPWLDEGLAEATSMAWRSGGRLALDQLEARRLAGVPHTLGGPLSMLAELVEAADRGVLPSLEELVGLDRQAFKTAGDRRLLYALSGLWVHYLGTARTESPDAFGDLLEAYRADPELDSESVSSALGVDLGELEIEFRRWLAELARALVPAAVERRVDP